MSTALLIVGLALAAALVVLLAVRARRRTLPRPDDKPAQTPAAALPHIEPEPEPEPKPEPKPEPAQEPARKQGVVSGATAEDVSALRKGLASTRSGFISRLSELVGGKREIDPSLLVEIEEVLIAADVGLKTTRQILDQLRERMNRKELLDGDRVWDAMRKEARSILGQDPGGLRLATRPAVVLVVGVNGVGKTTTIGKLASRLHEQGHRVVLAAGDTFRAAAVLQLEVWGRRVGVPVVRGKDGADPGAVVFDAIRKAKQDGADVVIADTAGRLHTKAPLMEELKKVARTIEKALDGRAADEILLVLDATNGQNALQQAQIFREALPVTGIVLTKLDGTAKGGVVLGIVCQHAIPIRYIGIGERVEDLREFDAPTFVEALFAKPDGETVAA